MRTSRAIHRSLARCALALSLLAAISMAPALAQLQGGTAYPINGTENPPVSFATITSAVAYMTANGVAGNGQVWLELSPGYAGEPGPLTIGIIPGVGATLGVTFRPTAGYTATTTTAGGASPNQYAIRITGNYITLDGRAGGTGSNRNWTITVTGSGTGGAGQSAVRFDDTNNNMTDNAVRYCELRGEAANTTSAIVGFAGASTYTFKNLVVENNLIRSTGVSATTTRGYAISLANMANAGNTGNIVRNNIMADTYANGIRITGTFPGLLVYGNEIYHSAVVAQPSSTEFSGIYFSTTTSGGTQIYSNFIHDIQLSGITSPVNGIYCYNASSSGNRVKIYNNRVAIGAGMPVATEVYGLRDQTVTSALLDFDYNSVYIGGAPASGSYNSAAFRKQVSSAINIRDNSLYNARSNSGSATGTHWAISINATTNIVAINRNDYFVSGVGGVLGTTDGTTTGNKTTLAAWKAAVPADANSISQNPYYVNPTGAPPNLRLDPTIPTALESGGMAIAGIDTDFEGDIRFGSGGYGGSGTAPDIGADEGEFTLLPADDVRAVAFLTPLDGGAQSGGVAFSPQATFENIGLNNQTNVPVRFLILDSDLVEVYSDSTAIATLNAGAGPQTVTFASCTLDSAGLYTMTAQSELVGDDNTSNDMIAGDFEVVAPLAGPYNIGAAQPAPYNSLTNAVGRLNQVGVSGPVTFVLVDATYTTPAETFPITINAFPGASALNTLTIRPSGPGVTITGSSATAIFKLNGADYVSLDGSAGRSRARDLTISNSSTGAGSAAIWLASLGVGAGCTDNTIADCNLACGSDQGASGAVETFGIYSGGTTISTGTGGNDNDRNAFSGNAITKSRWGIYLLGVVGNNNDGCTAMSNLIGSEAFDANRIGRGGIILRYQNEAAAVANEVRYVGVVYADGSSGMDRTGIGLGADSWTPTATTVALSTVSENYIHHIVDEKTYAAVGIIVAGSGSPSGNTIANNMIHDVRANGTASDQALGIGIADGNGDRVVYNSIALAGDLDPGSSTSASQSGAGIRVSSATPSNLTLKNNIISVDFSSNTGTLRHFTIVAPAASYAWGTGGSDNNDYYPNPANAQMALGGIGTTVPYTPVTTLAAWRTQFTPNQDAASLSISPPFISPSNLHLLTDVPTPLESGGVPIAGVGQDYDGDQRDVATPDVGADEGDFILPPTDDVRAVAFLNPLVGGTKIAGTAFAPQATFENIGLDDQSDVPVVFRIEGPAPQTTDVYVDSTTVASLLSYGGPAAATFDDCTLSEGGVYTMYARSELPGDENPGNDEIVGTFAVLAPLAGNYNVGAAEPVPFNSLTGAVGALNLVGVAGATTFTLVDASYTTPAETFPITINAYPGADSLRVVTIRPGISGVVISGSSASAIIKLNGADYVAIDGALEGGRGRDLTIRNTNTAGGTAAVWLSSLAAGQGCVGDAVRNCNLACGADQGSSNNETFGVIASGTQIATTSYGTDNDDNQLTGNAITRCRWGIYLLGVSGNTNDRNVVADNLIGPAAFGADRIGRGGIVLRYQASGAVTGNEVGYVGVLYADTGSGTDRVGIGIGGDGWTPTSTTVTGTVVTGNLIHHIVDEKTYAAAGIVVAGSGTPSANLIANNMIHNVRANGTYSDQAVGIGIADGNGDLVVFNSVYLTGDLDPGSCTTASMSAVGIRISGTTPTNLTLKDNITQVDVNSNTATLKHFSVVAPATSYAWGTGGSDYNDYYTPAANAQCVLGGIGTSVPYTEVPTLAQWQTQFTPNQDAASLAADPLFAGSDNLHIVTNGATPPVSDSGLAIAAVTDDHDGDARAATPDIGADEFNLFVPNLTVDDVAVAESGKARISAFFTLRLSGQTGNQVRVDVHTADDTAQGGVDYAPLETQTVVIAPQDTVATVEVSILDDLLDEDDETFMLILSTPVNAVITDSLGLGTILDDDATPSLAIGDVTIAEGDSGYVAAVFTVTLSAPSGRTLSAQYTTADSTATAGEDYVAISPPETVTFAPGDTLVKTITVSVIGEHAYEPDELFLVSLLEPVNVTLLDATGLGTILNDDEFSDVPIVPVPAHSFLAGSRPNPSPGAAVIHFGLSTAEDVRLDIYDLQGRLVRTLLDGPEAAGYKQIAWDGRSDRGHTVGSGLYFLRLHTDQETFRRTIRIVR